VVPGVAALLVACLAAAGWQWRTQLAGRGALAAGESSSSRWTLTWAACAGILGANATADFLAWATSFVVDAAGLASMGTLLFLGPLLALGYAGWRGLWDSPESPARPALHHAPLLAITPALLVFAAPLIQTAPAVVGVIPAPAPTVEAAAPADPAAPAPAAGPCTIDPAAETPGYGQAQRAIAVTIVQVGHDMGVSEQGQLVALMTGMQESGLRNYANATIPESLAIPHDAVGDDHSSVGVFQQQPQWWGPVAELMDIPTAARKFYAALLDVDDWTAMPYTRAAQAVQRSAYPLAYAKHETTARAVLAAVTCTDPRT
jgi:hypothetical protein